MKIPTASRWILGIVLVLLVSGAFFTVDETEVAILTRFGRPVGGVLGPGLHLRFPWPVDSVIRLDSRLLIFDNEPTEMLTRDKKNVLVDSFVCWKIADPLRFTQTVRTRGEAEARLLDIAVSETGAAVGSEPIESFLSTQNDQVKLEEISRRIGAGIDRLTRASFGIEVVDFQINGFNLPPQNRASVIERMRAERARIATRYRSEGEEEALKIQAETASQKTRILSLAEAQAESTRGAGEADALRIFSKAYAKDPDFYRFVRSLESYEKFIDNRTTIFLESNSKLLKALNAP